MTLVTDIGQFLSLPNLCDHVKLTLCHILPLLGNSKILSVVSQFYTEKIYKDTHCVLYMQIIISNSSSNNNNSSRSFWTMCFNQCIMLLFFVFFHFGLGLPAMSSTV